MKKRLMVLAAVAVMAVAVAGCGGVDNSTSTPENVGPPPAAAPQADAPPPMAAPTP